MEFRRTPEKSLALRVALLSVFCSFIVAGAVSVILSPVLRFKSAGLIGLVIGEFFIIVPALLYVRSHKYSITETFRLRGISPDILIAIIVIAVSLQPIVDEFDRLISRVLPFPEFLSEFVSQAEKALSVDSAGSFISIMLGAVLFAAVSEELLFRGFLQKAYEIDLSASKALFISSLIFALVHLSPQFIQIFLLGVLLGYLVMRTDSIVPGIVAHLINNGLAILYLNLGETRSESYLQNKHVSPLLLIPSIVIFTVAMWQFHRRTAAGDELLGEETASKSET